MISSVLGPCLTIIGICLALIIIPEFFKKHKCPACNCRTVIKEEDSLTYLHDKNKLIILVLNSICTNKECNYEWIDSSEIDLADQKFNQFKFKRKKK